MNLHWKHYRSGTVQELQSQLDSQEKRTNRIINDLERPQAKTLGQLTHFTSMQTSKEDVQVVCTALAAATCGTVVVDFLSMRLWLPSMTSIFQYELISIQSCYFSVPPSVAISFHQIFTSKRAKCYSSRYDLRSHPFTKTMLLWRWRTTTWIISVSNVFLYLSWKLYNLGH